MENSLMFTRQDTNRATPRKSRQSKGTRISKYLNVGALKVETFAPRTQIARKEASSDKPRRRPRMKMYGVSLAAMARIFLEKGASGFHLLVFSLLPKKTP